MNASGDAAEQVVRMTLEGVQVAAKITGDNADRVAKIIMSMLMDKKQTKGKASLTTLMKSNKPIKVFEIKDDELKKFCQEAKKYGVMYHVLKDKDQQNNKCDIMVRAEDASKVNRIFEKFHLGTDNKDTIRESVKKATEKDKRPQSRTEPGKSADDKFLDELFGKPKQEKTEKSDNPSRAKTEKSHPSAPISGSKSSRTSRDYYDSSSRPSVRAQLRDIRADQEKARAKNLKPKTPTKKRGEKVNVRNR